MDPDVVLAAARAAIERGETAYAAELFNALDKWIMRGGFLPKEWRDALAGVVGELQEADLAALRAAWLEAGQ